MVTCILFVGCGEVCRKCLFSAYATYRRHTYAPYISGGCSLRVVPVAYFDGMAWHGVECASTTVIAIPASG